MNCQGKVILLTGAGSGIGQQLAIKLAAKGANLILLGRTRSKLEETTKKCESFGVSVRILEGDLADLKSISEIVRNALAFFGHIDVLMNNAGVLSYKHFENERTDELVQLFQTNVLAPMVLIRELLPHLRTRREAAIVNTGSIFGSIAFAYFAAYCSSKSALRGFSEALRRELQDTKISVTYVAPRATKTGLANVFDKMAEKVGMKMDDPAQVAEIIVKGFERKKKNVYIGFPECLFVRINGLFPGFVDNALRKQNKIMETYAK